MSGTARASAAHSPVFEKTLPNGLKVLIQEVHTAPVVSFMVWYRVGSRNESTGITGISHLLEHMMFKGTPTYRNVMKLLGEKGAQLNGTTWLDRTNYYETLPASQENLDYALALEADRMRNASISPDDLKTEFSVVRNEFEMGENNPQGVLDKLKSAKIPYYTEAAPNNLTRVRAGPFATREAAEKALQQLKSLGLQPGAVTSRSG